MEIILPVLLSIALIVLLFSFLFKQKKKPLNYTQPIPEGYRQILEEQSIFYRQLDPVKKRRVW